MKIHQRKRADGETYCAFDCPGCGGIHDIPVTGPKAWGYNGNPAAPTLTPSILYQWTEGEERKRFCCHSFVIDGRIQFLTDCTHALAGQTVDLPDLEGPDAR